jgi:mono/diheme cytochrome c family protein
MMPFKEKLDSSQIAAILTYIRNSWGNQASPVDARQVH